LALTIFVTHGSPHPRDLHSFPTRRSSDLLSHGVPDCHGGRGTGRSRYLTVGGRGGVVPLTRRGQGWVNGRSTAFWKIIPRQRQAAGRNCVRHQRERKPEGGNNQSFENDTFEFPLHKPQFNTSIRLEKAQNPQKIRPRRDSSSLGRGARIRPRPLRSPPAQGKC